MNKKELLKTYGSTFLNLAPLLSSNYFPGIPVPAKYKPAFEVQVSRKGIKIVNNMRRK